MIHIIIIMSLSLNTVVTIVTIDFNFTIDLLAMFNEPIKKKKKKRKNVLIENCMLLSAQR